MAAAATLLAVLGSIFCPLARGRPPRHGTRALQQHRHRQSRVRDAFEVDAKVWARRAARAGGTGRHATPTIMPYDELPSLKLHTLDGRVLKLEKDAAPMAHAPPKIYFLIMCHGGNSLSQSVCNKSQAEWMSKAPDNAHFVFMSYGECHDRPKSGDASSAACLSDTDAAMTRIRSAQMSPPADTPAARYVSELDTSRVHFVKDNPGSMASSLSRRLVARPAWSRQALSIRLSGAAIASATGALRPVNSSEYEWFSLDNESSPPPRGVSGLGGYRSDRAVDPAHQVKFRSSRIHQRAHRGAHHHTNPYSTKKIDPKYATTAPLEAVPLFGCDSDTIVTIANRFPQNRPLVDLGLSCAPLKPHLRKKLQKWPRHLGFIAVIRRGKCTFSSKIMRAARAGARGVVLVSTRHKPPVPITYKNAHTCKDIPSIMVNYATGSALRTVLKTASAKYHQKKISGIVAELTARIQGPLFLGIDTGFRVRPVGSFSYASLLDAAKELRHFNYEWRTRERIKRLESSCDAATVTVFSARRDHLGNNITALVHLPPKALRAKRLHIGMQLQCRQRLRSNCGQWDQLLLLQAYPPSTPDLSHTTTSGAQVARWVTPYSSEGSWLTDVTPMLAVLRKQSGRSRSVALKLTTVDGIIVDHNVTLRLIFSNADDDGLIGDVDMVNSTQQYPTSTNDLHGSQVWKKSYHHHQKHIARPKPGSPRLSLLHKNVHKSLNRKPVVKGQPHSRHKIHNRRKPCGVSQKNACGKASDRPFLSLPLFKGGNFNRYNSPPNIRRRSFVLSTVPDTRGSASCGDPVRVGVSSGQSRVQWAQSAPFYFTRAVVAALVSGHGWGFDEENCAEFCPHKHNMYTKASIIPEPAPGHLGDASSAARGVFVRDFRTSGTAFGCADRIDDGVTPNQYGTWEMGRSGWCPGLDVPLWAFEVPLPTTDLSSGQQLVLQIDYNATHHEEEFVFEEVVQNATGFPPKIHMTSYIVFYGSSGN